MQHSISFSPLNTHLTLAGEYVYMCLVLISCIIFKIEMLAVVLSNDFADDVIDQLCICIACT